MTSTLLILISESEVKLLSHDQLFATPWTVAYQDPQSMGFSRQEYWSGLPFSSPRDLPDPGIEPMTLASHALAGGFKQGAENYIKDNGTEVG